MLVGLAVALAPVVKLAHAQLQPPQQSLDRKASLLGPASDEVHHRIADIRLDPAAVQSSPSSFFNATCSAINSARTSSFCRIFFSSFSMCCCSCFRSGERLPCRANAAFRNNCSCQRWNILGANCASSQIFETVTFSIRWLRKSFDLSSEL